MAWQCPRAGERDPARHGHGLGRRHSARAPADRPRLRRGERGRRRLAGRDHREEDGRVRARSARPRLGESAQSHGGPRRKAPPPRGYARDQGQPGPSRPAARHQPQHAKEEAQRARH
ncbi:MAG TPA: hypothetical protein VGV06_21200 [Methylomirabilota bacterium]|nr:hypothetical protein [Methylomirabilota bacterium]